LEIQNPNPSAFVMLSEAKHPAPIFLENQFGEPLIELVLDSSLRSE